MNVQEIVNAQAEDEGLWFMARTCAEAYLQQELRRLHAAIEADKHFGLSQDTLREAVRLLVEECICIGCEPICETHAFLARPGIVELLAKLETEEDGR